MALANRIHSNQRRAGVKGEAGYGPYAYTLHGTDVDTIYYWSDEVSNLSATSDGALLRDSRRAARRQGRQAALFLGLLLRQGRARGDDKGRLASHRESVHSCDRDRCDLPDHRAEVCIC